MAGGSFKKSLTLDLDEATFVRLEEDADPETNDKRILVCVTLTNCGTEQILNASDAYTDEIVKTLSPEKRAHIRLSYDIS